MSTQPFDLKKSVDQSPALLLNKWLPVWTFPPPPMLMILYYFNCKCSVLLTFLYFYFRPLVYEEEETLTCSEGSDETKKEDTP